MIPVEYRRGLSVDGYKMGNVELDVAVRPSGSFTPELVRTTFTAAMLAAEYI
jgi:hypothetical protein